MILGLPWREGRSNYLVIPAQAGIQKIKYLNALDSQLRGNNNQAIIQWLP